MAVSKGDAKAKTDTKIDYMLLARYVIVVLALLYLYSTGGLSATIVAMGIVGIVFPTTHALSVLGVGASKTS